MREAANTTALRAGYATVAPDGTQNANAPINQGCIPGSRMAASVNPTANDTIAIGSTTFKIVAALGAAAAQVQVLRNGTTATTYANLVNAINGDAASKNVTWVEATTPFAAAVVADMVQATQLRLRMATARGGKAMAGVSGSIALTAAITGGASAWSVANLNQSGKSPADCNQAYGQITVTAAMITNTFVDIELPFQPILQDIYVIDPTGLQRFITDQVTIPANQQCLHVALPGGAAPHVQANDIIVYWAAV